MEASVAKKEPIQERKVIVTIRSADKKKPVTLDTWRYWEIVGELRWMGVDYVQATDAAKWAQRAKPGDINRVDDILMEVKNGTADK
jgi:hypothetical protein